MLFALSKKAGQWYPKNNLTNRVEKTLSVEKQQVDTPEADEVLDTCGLFCPEPVMMLHNKVRDIPVGAVLEIIATDPATQRDIPKFCHFLGHELLAQEVDGKLFRYWLKTS